MILVLVALVAAVFAFALAIFGPDVARRFSRRGGVDPEVQATIDSLLALIEDGDENLADAQAEIAALQASAASTEPSEWLEAVMTKRITVHLSNDLTIEGSLVSRMDDGIVLRAAKLVDGTPNGTAMVGDVWLSRDKVLMAQLDT